MSEFGLVKPTHLPLTISDPVYGLQIDGNKPTPFGKQFVSNLANFLTEFTKYISYEEASIYQTGKIITNDPRNNQFGTYNTDFGRVQGEYESNGVTYKGAGLGKRTPNFKFQSMFNKFDYIDDVPEVNFFVSQADADPAFTNKITSDGNIESSVVPVYSFDSNSSYRTNYVDMLYNLNGLGNPNIAAYTDTYFSQAKAAFVGMKTYKDGDLSQSYDPTIYGLIMNKLAPWNDGGTFNDINADKIIDSGESITYNNSLDPWWTGKDVGSTALDLLTTLSESRRRLLLGLTTLLGPHTQFGLTDPAQIDTQMKAWFDVWSTGKQGTQSGTIDKASFLLPLEAMKRLTQWTTIFSGNAGIESLNDAIRFLGRNLNGTYNSNIGFTRWIARILDGYRGNSTSGFIGSISGVSGLTGTYSTLQDVINLLPSIKDGLKIVTRNYLDYEAQIKGASDLNAATGAIANLNNEITLIKNGYSYDQIVYEFLYGNGGQNGGPALYNPDSTYYSPAANYGLQPSSVNGKNWDYSGSGWMQYDKNSISEIAADSYTPYIFLTRATNSMIKNKYDRDMEKYKQEKEEKYNEKLLDRKAAAKSEAARKNSLKMLEVTQVSKKAPKKQK